MRVSKYKATIAAAATAAVVAALAATFVIYSADNGENNATPAPGEVSVSADELLPGTTATDWATYGDYVVQVSVRSEAALPADPDVARTGEGLIGRTVDVNINNVYWSRPGLPTAPPKSLTLSTLGWQLKDGRRIPLSANGFPRLNVGATYLMPITNFTGNLNSPKWGTLSANTTLTVAGEQISTVPQKNSEVPPRTFAAELLSKPARSLTQRLNATPPAAGADLQLPPVARLNAAPR